MLYPFIRSLNFIHYLQQKIAFTNSSLSGKYFDQIISDKRSDDFNISIAFYVLFYIFRVCKATRNMRFVLHIQKNQMPEESFV